MDILATKIIQGEFVIMNISNENIMALEYQTPRFELYRIPSEELVTEKAGKLQLKTPAALISDAGLSLLPMTGKYAVDAAVINTVDFFKLTNVGGGLATNVNIIIGTSIVPYNYSYAVQEGFVFALLPQVKEKNMVIDSIGISFSNSKGHPQFSQKFEIVLSTFGQGFGLNCQLKSDVQIVGQNADTDQQ